ncbi:hypothetical protein [Heyndrickxia acidicola]|uniref:Uncharacterized protein n=1 Tax=Heyndrickxia acidicola TaxID=209389 RepID=A0ABU6MI03_9BACI|nr:hypothetical protein [Heyndrickxia acidicola]MED1204310.1 hypothetical protein [Heyndrickxia acidicola]
MLFTGLIHLSDQPVMKLSIKATNKELAEEGLKKKAQIISNRKDKKIVATEVYEFNEVKPDIVMY